MKIGDLVRRTHSPGIGKTGVIIEELWSRWEEESVFLVACSDDGTIEEWGEWRIEIVVVPVIA